MNDFDVFFPPSDHKSIPIRIPLFEQTKNSIFQKIQSGDWSAEEPLPNEIELAKLFHVSQGTIRRALSELVADGILVRKQGKGTFISVFNADPIQYCHKFVHVSPDDNDEIWNTKKKMTHFEVIKPSQRVLRLMNIQDPNEDIIHIKRLHYARLQGQDEIVDAFDELFLRKKFFPNLTQETFQGRKRSLYAFYQRNDGVLIFHTIDHLKACLLNSEQAKLAGVTPPYPAIITQRQSFDVNDNLVELRYLVTVTNRCHFEYRT